MNKSFITFIFILVGLYSYSLADPVAYTLQLKGKKSQINVVTDGKKIDVTFTYPMASRSITIFS